MPYRTTSCLIFGIIYNLVFAPSTVPSLPSSTEPHALIALIFGGPGKAVRITLCLTGRLLSCPSSDRSSKNSPTRPYCRLACIKQIKS
uniref:Secreted protein n=1 Tax=Picea glauca TaxID=3330 RepID=A0A117NG75_PICGL|nr:hypothetical protein ABT39_MTgene1848 [Picea glauca]